MNKFLYHFKLFFLSFIFGNILNNNHIIAKETKSSKKKVKIEVSTSLSGDVLFTDSLQEMKFDDINQILIPGAKTFLFKDLKKELIPGTPFYSAMKLNIKFLYQDYWTQYTPFINIKVKGKEKSMPLEASCWGLNIQNFLNHDKSKSIVIQLGCSDSFIFDPTFGFSETSALGDHKMYFTPDFMGKTIVYGQSPSGCMFGLDNNLLRGDIAYKTKNFIIFAGMTPNKTFDNKRPNNFEEIYTGGITLKKSLPSIMGTVGGTLSGGISSFNENLIFDKNQLVRPCQAKITGFFGAGTIKFAAFYALDWSLVAKNKATPVFDFIKTTCPKQTSGITASIDIRKINIGGMYVMVNQNYDHLTTKQNSVTTHYVGVALSHKMGYFNYSLSAMCPIFNNLFDNKQKPINEKLIETHILTTNFKENLFKKPTNPWIISFGISFKANFVQEIPLGEA